MNDKKRQETIRDVVKQVRRLRGTSDCAKKCEVQWKRDLDRCGEDYDCVVRVTGKYLICVAACPKK
jgi:hypothetical protein